MGDRTRAEGMIDEAKGNVKQTVGRATGDERTEAEGKLDEVKGNLKQGLADAQDTIEDLGRDRQDQQ
jgi:uncharacterized protein YjbJ (UPF0337 family)